MREVSFPNHNLRLCTEGKKENKNIEVLFVGYGITNLLIVPPIFCFNIVSIVIFYLCTI